MLTDPNRQTVIRLPEHSTRVQLLWKLQTDTHTHKQNRSYCLSRRLQHCIRTTGAERSQPQTLRQKEKRSEKEEKFSLKKKKKKKHTQPTTSAAWEINRSFFSLFDSRLTWDILLITFSKARNN